MKKKIYTGYLVIFFLILMLSILTMPVLSGEGKVKWIDSYDRALKEAADEDQLMLIQIITDTCPYCTKMEREIFHTDEMAKICEQVKCVIVNGSKDNKAVELARKFNVKGVPTTLLLTEEEEFVSIVRGYLPLQKFVYAVNSVIKKANKFDRSLKILKKNSDNLKAMYNVAEGYYERKQYDRALELADRIIESDPENKQDQTVKAYILKAGIHVFKEKDTKRALELLNHAIDKWSESPDIKVALYTKGIILYYREDKDKGREVLQTLKNKYPADRQLIARIDSVLKD